MNSLVLSSIPIPVRVYKHYMFESEHDKHNWAVGDEQ